MKPTPPVNKNDEFELRIDDITTEGAGVGKKDGFALFVPGALPGETALVRVVKVTRGYGYAKALATVSPSPYRVAPACPAAGRCGGCSLQHMAYDGQLAFKEKRLRDSLSRIGGITEPNVLPIIGGQALGYRNKAQLPVRTVDGAAAVGFFAPGSHRLAPLADCPLQMRPIRPYIAALKAYMAETNAQPYDEETGAGVVRHLLLRFAGAAALVCVVINAERLPKANRLVARMRSIPGVTGVAANVNTARSNVILGEKTTPLWGDPFLTETLCGEQFRFGAGAFFQVNPGQAARLYEAALALAAPEAGDTVVDAYCGVGTLSLLFARRANTVYGIEIAPAAIESARQNADLNGVGNAAFICGASGSTLTKMAADGLKPAIVIVDPPRAGCDAETLAAIQAMRPAKILYVSCDPGTLARDLKTLCAGEAYRLSAARPVDMFPQTAHVEAAALLERIG